MDDDMKRLLGGLIEAQRDIVKLCHEAKVESAALQAVCGALAAEIAMLDDAPRERLNQILGAIEGTASAVAAETQSPHTTATIENICALAESLMPSGSA